MELEFENGSKKFPMDKGSKIVLGRSHLAFPSDDRTVSRRHLSLQVHEPAQTFFAEESFPDGEISAYFHVTGKNPIWVLTRDGEKKRVYRNSEKGVLRAGDRFTISLKNAVFLILRKRDFKEKEEDDDDEKRILKAVERRKKRTLERKDEERMRVLEDQCSPVDCSVDDASIALGLGSLDLSRINPVEEFGFLVLGQEFNQFPEQKIRHLKDWNWFLEELKESSEDDQAEDNETEKRRAGRKKKKRGEVEDDDWTGESMDEEGLVAKLRNGKRPKYSTRSKDWKNLSKDTSSKKSVHQKTISADEDENDEKDEDYDTLAGFVVDDELEEEEEEEEDDSHENDLDEEEEEEYDEDDDVDNGEEDPDD